MIRVFAALLVVAGCGGGKSGIRVTIQAAMTIADITRVTVTVENEGQKGTADFSASGFLEAGRAQTLFLLLPPGRQGRASIMAEVHGAAGVLARGDTSVNIELGRQVDAMVFLTGVPLPDMGGPSDLSIDDAWAADLAAVDLAADIPALDLSSDDSTAETVDIALSPDLSTGLDLHSPDLMPPPDLILLPDLTLGDMKPPSCTDNHKNGDESDVDCGGSCPMKCSAGKGCNASADCKATAACFQNRCSCTTKPNFNNFALQGNLNYPVGVAIVDLDNNGGLDLAVANMNDCSITIFLNDGSATFKFSQRLMVGCTKARSIETGRFDGNAFSDLVIGTVGGDKVHVLLNDGLNDGNGLFQGPGTALAAGTDPIGIRTPDLNNDQLDDLVVGSSSGLAIVMNSPMPMGFKTMMSLPAGGHCSATAAGDWNGDGRVDIACTGAVGSVVTFVQEANNGSFKGAQKIDWSGYTLDTAVCKGAVNLVSGREAKAPHLGLLRNFNKGDFQPPLEAGVVPNTTGLAVGDLNLDGLPDVALVSNHFTVDNLNFVALFYAKQDCTYSDQARVDAGVDEFDVGLGDLDGNGKLDMVVTNGKNSLLQVYLNLCE